MTIQIRFTSAMYVIRGFENIQVLFHYENRASTPGTEQQQ